MTEDWLVKGTSISRQEKSSERHSGQEGFDSGVSWDQDFTLNERESERPIINVPDKQGGEPNHEGESTPSRRTASWLEAAFMYDFSPSSPKNLSLI